MYEVESGELVNPEGELVGIGYSGSPIARNDVTMEQEHDVGPLPRGVYKISEPVDTPTHGPYVMSLTPQEGNMYGRSGFLIHGDSIEHPGAASHGCIVLGRPLREMIGRSIDHELEVM